MNSENERKLFSDFINPVENPNSVLIPDYPRLNPNCVKKISKTLSKILYESLKTENSTSKKNRDTIIGLLSKWVTNSKGESHVTLNEQNRDLFLRSIYSRPKTQNIKQLFQEFYEEINREDIKINIWEEMYQNFENMNKINTENKMAKDLIQALDNSYLKQTGFHCSVPSKIIQKNDFEKSLIALKEVVDNNRDFKTLSTQNIINTTKNSIPLGYSLLNLERNEKNLELLLNILEEIFKKDDKTNEEVNFIFYIWNNEENLNLPENIYEEMLNSCPFLYERPLLKLAKEILDSDEDFETLLNKSDLKKFIIKIKDNKMIQCNIISCIYELYSLSNYNENILKLLSL